MQTSTIKYKNLNAELRIDAEYYRAEVLEKLEVLNKRDRISLGNIASFVVGPFGSTVTVDQYVEKSDFRYVRNKDIYDFRIGDDDSSLIPETVFNSLPQFHIREDDLLVTVVGTLGKVAIARKKDTKSIFSCKSTIIRTKKIDPYYLLTYLNSRTGRIFVLRGTRGAIQQGLNLSDLKEIQVYIPSPKLQHKIRDVVTLGFQSSEEASQLYAKAEQVLLSELGFVDWKPKHKLSFVKNFSDTTSADRIDAEHFQTKYDEIKELLKRGKCVPLSKCFDLISGTYFDYVDEGNVGVIKTKQLNDRFISFEVESKTSEKLLQDNNLPEIRDKDVLFASMGIGSLGKANIYYEFENSKRGKFTIDSTIRIMRKKPNSEIKSELLTLYLSSLVGQELIYQNIVGTSGIISIYKDDLGNLPVPLLDNNVQERISEFVIQAHKGRRNSKQLLDIAKRGVEMAIEKTEEEATKWLHEEVKSECQITM